MKIAELDDGKTVKLMRQAAQRNFNSLKLQIIGFEIPIGA
jgi:hypothetical protein